MVRPITDNNLNTEEMTYDENDNILTIKDKADNVTTFEYDAVHPYLVSKIYRPSRMIDDSPVTYNPTEFEYDSYGNLKKVKDATGNEVVMTYDIDGLVLSVKNRNNHITEFEYDGIPQSGARRNLLKVKVPKGDSGSDGFRTMTFAYDNFDNVTSVKDDLGNEVLTTYDGLDRPLSIFDALLKETTFEYEDLKLLKTVLPSNNGSDENPRTVSMAYDGVSRLTEIHRATNALGGTELRVKYAHTGYSQIKTLSRLKGGVEKSYSFAYDEAGRLTSTTDPLGSPGVSTMAYAPFCKENAVSTARGLRRRTVLDPRCLPLRLEIGEPDPNDPLELAVVRDLREWEYDELGRLVKTSQGGDGQIYGQAVAGLDVYGSRAEVREFLYDELDRLETMRFPDGKEMSWEYDPEGNVTKVTDSEEKVTEYTYYRDNLLKEVILKRPSVADRKFAYSYDAAGRLAKIAYPSGTQMEAKFDDGSNTSGSGWDANGQLCHLRYEKNELLYRRFEFIYDDSGNRASMLEESEDGSAIKWEYGYDWFDRLIAVKRGQASSVGAMPNPLPDFASYSYDESDNRITHGVYSSASLLERTFRYVYDDANNLIEIYLTEGSDPEVLVEEVTSDADGNMTTRTNIATGETIHYEWDGSDRLNRVRSESGGVKTNTASESNRYDANGIRKRKIGKNGNSSLEYTAGISTSSASPGSTGSSAPEISYVMGHQILGAEVDGDFQFFLTDALGTVRDVIDDTGTVIQSYEFSEHGLPMPGSGASSGTFSPKTYQGALSVNDDRNDSGLYLMGHRHYDSTLGRFISRDPIGFRGGLNLFNGHGTDPISTVDPTGLEVLPIGVYARDAQRQGELMTGNSPADWWIWESTLPGPYGDPNPENWGEWNDLVDYVCSHGSGSERVIFISSLVTGVAATTAAATTGIAQACGKIPQMVIDGKQFGKSGGRLFQVRPNVGRGLSKRASEGIFRLDWHKIPGSVKNVLHYHVKPNMRAHLELGLKEAGAAAGAVAVYAAFIIKCKPVKECK